MLEDPAASAVLNRRRPWRGRAACLGLGILCALLGQGIAGWLTGPGAAERLVTLPVAVGLLLWLLSQVLREALLLLRWPPRQPVSGTGGVKLLCTLLGFGMMLLPPDWLGWGVLVVAGAGLARAAVGLWRRRRAGGLPPAVP